MAANSPEQVVAQLADIMGKYHWSERWLAAQLQRHRNTLKKVLLGQLDTKTQRDIYLQILELAANPQQRLGVSNIHPDGSVVDDIGTQVPVLGDITAGPFKLAAQEENPKFIEGARSDRMCYVLKVIGDSMSPKYLEGDRIFCKPLDVTLPAQAKGAKGQVPIEEVEWLHGKDCVCMLDGESTFKRVEIDPARGGTYRVHLVPVNDAYGRVTLKPEQELKIQGNVYKLVRYG